MTTQIVPQKPTSFRIYWQALRVYSFPASIVPILLGTVLAVQQSHRFYLLSFLLTLLGGVLAHAAANVYNDYYDYKNHVDVRPEHGSGVLTQRLLSAKQMFDFGTLLSAASLACGFLLLLMLGSSSSTGGIVGLVVVGALAALLYSMVLKRYALGDLLIVLTFGFGFSLGAYLTQMAPLKLASVERVLLLSLPVASLVDAILHANNLRDRLDDRQAGVYTLANLLPLAWGKALLMGLLFFPLLFVVVGVLGHLLPPIALLTLLALPTIVKAYRTINVVGTAQAHLLFGLLYTLSLGLSLLAR
ncbi:1,4-dihydroxy-2-naphthoate prenyltransferase [Chthonomonas calidirosea]|uniref:prenyltransferase n=1 Tax=Chthonomonas calidirosea TaxID=454171 RepID=UPI0006DD4F11|nr:prenyltransferase [Chthonomonas calidirosea]CEK19272.1 1,4-dihydroxy-2-naphthoate prenyltransferase [Chthonomonas calidirosea]